MSRVLKFMNLLPVHILGIAAAMPDFKTQDKIVLSH